MSRFSENQNATDFFYEDFKGKAIFNELKSFMQSDVVTGFEIVGENAIHSFNQFLGPEDAGVAKSSDPNSIRARFGTNFIKNAVHSVVA